MDLSSFHDSLRLELPNPSSPSNPGSPGGSVASKSRYEILFHESRSGEAQQDERRRALLRELRNRKRDELLLQRYAENLDAVNNHISDVEKSDPLKRDRVSSASSSVGSKKSPSRRKDRPPRLMLSEWLVEIPEDFEDNWLMLKCPVGKRTSIVATSGRTAVFSRTGLFVMSGVSDLPGGNARQPGREHQTILDCFWNASLKTFFVFDLLCWNGTPVAEQGAEFRFFWLESRFRESADISLLAENGEQYKVALLPRYSCDPETLHREFLSSSGDYPLDGFMFFHKEGVYFSGTTPLTCWLKPFMVPEILKMPVSPKYDQRPPGYTNLREFIAQQEAKNKTKNQSNRKGNTGVVELME